MTQESWTPAPTPRLTDLVRDISHLNVSGSGGQASHTRNTPRTSSIVNPRILESESWDKPESIRKRRKSMAGIGSSGSSLTHVDRH
jgi:hypothetical protein